MVSCVRERVIAIFESQLKQQALQHVRHRVKHDVEVRIDMKFKSINALEDHMLDLVNELNPRGFYDQVCRDFHTMVHHNDYAGVLKVFNHKPLLGEVATLCGFHSKEDYIKHYNAKPVPDGFHYSSDSNDQWETVETLREKISQL